MGIFASTLTAPVTLGAGLAVSSPGIAEVSRIQHRPRQSILPTDATRGIAMTHGVR